jgi:endonuclease YncB( thermonuclease family)
MSSPRGLRPTTVPYFLAILLFGSIIVNIIFARQLYTGRIVASVYDGDSFVLADGTRVRLMGVDAPEAGRCGYQEAKDFLTGLISGRHVRLKNTLTDDYGRLVANVIVEDFGYWTKYITWKFSRNFITVIGRVTRAEGLPRRGPLVGFLGRKPAAGPSEQNLYSNVSPFPNPDPMVNRAMAAAGLAKNLSTNSEYKKVITDAAAYAKERGLGIYSTQCRSAVSQSGCTIKGNVQQEGKYFFVPGCKPYANVIVDTSFGDVWFCSEQEAVKSGFILSPTCR